MALGTRPYKVGGIIGEYQIQFGPNKTGDSFKIWLILYYNYENFLCVLV